MSQREVDHTPAPTSEIERQARRLWLADAVDRKFKRCDGCGRVKDVVRKSNSPKWLCLTCFDEGDA